MKYWKSQRFFLVPNPRINTKIQELLGPTAEIRMKKLRIFGNVELTNEDILACFCYDMVNPTQRRIEEDMHHFQIDIQNNYKTKKLL